MSIPRVDKSAVPGRQALSRPGLRERNRVRPGVKSVVVESAARAAFRTKRNQAKAVRAASWVSVPSSTGSGPVSDTGFGVNEACGIGTVVIVGSSPASVNTRICTIVAQFSNAPENRPTQCRIVRRRAGSAHRHCPAPARGLAALLLRCHARRLPFDLTSVCLVLIG
jgi:hypothetical protein